MLRIKNLSYEIEEKNLIEDISFHVEKGKFIGIVGPNGSGKSTLLKNIYRTLKGEGKIDLKGRCLKVISSKELARDMAVVSQHGGSEFDFSVCEMVTMGRYPHKSFLGSYNGEDRKIVNGAIEKLGLKEYKDRAFLSLSGGERQRALIARALAQKADIIILDEPTNHLDIRYQLQIMAILKSLPITVVAAVHDMNIASLYCDEIIALKDGKLWDKGSAEKVFSREFFRDVFNVETEISRNISTQKLSITYLPTEVVY